MRRFVSSYTVQTDSRMLVQLYVVASRIMQLGHTNRPGMHTFPILACPLVIAIRLTYDLDGKSKEGEMVVERWMNEVDDGKPMWNWTQA